MFGSAGADKVPLSVKSEPFIFTIPLVSGAKLHASSVTSLAVLRLARRKESREEAANALCEKG